MSIFAQAAQGLSLTPGQRAALKVVKGFVISAVASGVTAAAQLLTASSTVDWSKVAQVGGVAFATSLAFALDKYWTAQGDIPLATIAAEVGQAFETKAAPGETVIPFTAPAPSDVPTASA